VPSWRDLGSVIVGAVVTTVLGGLSLLAMPFMGLLASATLGNWLPQWVFAVPLGLAPVAGGATASGLRAYSLRDGGVVGALAGAGGALVIGIFLGLLLTVIVLGLMPYQGQETDVGALTLWFAALGAAGGLLSGAVLGAIGGLGVSAGRS
jgi:hypothetical protein